MNIIYIHINRRTDVPVRFLDFIRHTFSCVVTGSHKAVSSRTSLRNWMVYYNLSDIPDRQQR